MRAYMCIYEYPRLNYQLGAPGALLVGTPGALPVGTSVPYTCDKCNTRAPRLYDRDYFFRLRPAVFAYCIEA